MYPASPGCPEGGSVNTYAYAYGRTYAYAYGRTYACPEGGSVNTYAYGRTLATSNV